MRTPSNSHRSLGRRSTLAGLALLTCLATGVAGASTASANDDAGGVEAAVYEVVDPILNPLLGSAEESGEDNTELNLECDPETGSCRQVPGPEDEPTAITTAPVDTPAAKATPRHGKSHPRR